MAAIKEFSIFPSEEDIEPSRQPFIIQSTLPVPPDASSFIFNKPWSKQADQEGIFTAQFLLDNADKIKSASAKRDILQTALDEELGVESPKIEVTFFRNWGETYSGVVMLAKPKLRKQVQAIVKHAALSKIKMRGGGGYHTWSKFHPDDGNLLINTSELELPDPDYPRYKIDKDAMTITLSPGVNNAEILKPMIKADVCFRSSVIIPTTTFGGMLSGGCHGVGIDQKPMSDWMTSMKIVNYKGEVQTIPDEALSPDEKEDVLKAARVNLGTFGIIVEMTINVSPMENVRVENLFDITLADAYGSSSGLSYYLKKYWSLHILWIPFSSLDLSKAALQPIFPSLVGWNPDEDYVYLRGINRAKDSDETKPAPDLVQHAFDALSQGAMGLQGRLMSKMPTTTPLMLTIAFQALRKNNSYPEVVQMPWGVFFRDGLDFCRAYDMEFDFPLDIENPEKVIQAIKILKDLTMRYAKGEYMSISDNKYPFTMFCEVRFISSSDSYLCPSNVFQPSSQYTACIEVQSTYATQDYQKFFGELEKAWMDLGGIPHWQKQWDFPPNEIIPYMREKYGERIDKFLGVRKFLEIDNEDNLFMNEMLMKVLKER